MASVFSREVPPQEFAGGNQAIVLVEAVVKSRIDLKGGHSFHQREGHDHEPQDLGWYVAGNLSRANIPADTG